MTDIIQNFKIVIELYMYLQNTIGEFLIEYLHNCPISKQEKIDEDLRLNTFEFLNFQNNYNSKELLNTYDFFFYKFGRFPSDLNLTKVFQKSFSCCF